MDTWFQLAIALNVVVLATFVFLLSRRRWALGGLAISVLHLVLATFSSAAPFRAALDPEYAGLGLGLLRFERQEAIVPAAVFLVWAVTCILVPLLGGTSKRMLVIALGDGLWALNIGASILISRDWTFQLGEFLTIDGVPGLLVLWGLFTLPFAVSAVWAVSGVRRAGPPPAEKSQDLGSDTTPSTKGFRGRGRTLLRANPAGA